MVSGQPTVDVAKKLKEKGMEDVAWGHICEADVFNLMALENKAAKDEGTPLRRSRSSQHQIYTPPSAPPPAQQQQQQQQAVYPAVPYYNNQAQINMNHENTPTIIHTLSHLSLNNQPTPTAPINNSVR